MKALAAMKATFPISPFAAQGYFRFHRPVAKTKDESQSEERRESDQAAKFENKKRRDNPKHDDEQSRIETDSGHRVSPVSLRPFKAKPRSEPSLFRFDGLGRRPGPRLHRAQEKIRHMIAEPDDGRVVVPARLRRVAALPAWRPVDGIRRVRSLGLGRTCGRALTHRSVTARSAVGGSRGCGA
jgi:hypothetical protein